MDLFINANWQGEGQSVYLEQTDPEKFTEGEFYFIRSPLFVTDMIYVNYWLCYMFYIID